MPNIPGVNHKGAVRVFEKLGYKIVRQSGILPSSEIMSWFQGVNLFGLEDYSFPKKY